MTIELHLGDCLNVMTGMPENSIDSIITDPPYGLSFMGKDWDHGVPGEAFWKAALRVAKPGAMLMAFGGTRTHHRLMVAIEDAGWILRDTVMWVYGQGFPKSHDISRAIDKAAGAKREVVGPNHNWRDVRGHNTVAYGQGAGINVRSENITAPATDLARTWDGWGTALKPAWEPVILAMAPLDGTFAQNAEKWGVAGLWIDGGRVGTEQTTTTIKDLSQAHGNQFGKAGITYPKIGEKLNPPGRFPANLIHDGSAEVVGLFPSNAAGSHKQEPTHSTNAAFGGGRYDNSSCYGDSGSAARFFKACPQDTLCALCDLPMTPRHSIMSETSQEAMPCNSTYASDAGRSLRTIQATIASIAPRSAQQPLVEETALNVPYAESLCDSCATRIALGLVGIKTSAINREELPAILASIGNSNRNILIQNLVPFVELWEGIDIIPTTESLLMLCGSVLHAIASSTRQGSRGVAEGVKDQARAIRLKYSPKASRKERNAGLEGMEAKVTHAAYGDYAGTPEHATNVGEMRRNHHPTVKPLALMEYLCKLTRTPTGGVVLDPFMGSGTTGIACVKTGRGFIGIEIDADYFKIAEARIAHAQREPQQAEMALLAMGELG